MAGLVHPHSSYTGKWSTSFQKEAAASSHSLVPCSKAQQLLIQAGSSRPWAECISCHPALSLPVRSEPKPLSSHGCAKGGKSAFPGVGACSQKVSKTVTDRMNILTLRGDSVEFFTTHKHPQVIMPAFVIAPLFLAILCSQPYAQIAWWGHCID